MGKPIGEIGEELRRQRLASHLTQEALAKRLGMPVSVISRFERGGRDPRWSTVLELARSLNVEPMLIPHDKIRAVEAVLGFDPTRAQDDEMPLIPEADED